MNGSSSRKAKMGIKVFLAHAKEDAARVRNLYDLLQSAGATPWMAPQDITPGAKWDVTIRETIQTSDFVVACLSENSVKRRGYVQREFRLALDVSLEVPEPLSFLIPVRLDLCEAPNLQVWQLNLRDLQWVDALSEGSLARLFASLRLADSIPVAGLLMFFWSVQQHRQGNQRSASSPCLGFACIWSLD
jgi:hypothetical protein